MRSISIGVAVLSFACSCGSAPPPAASSTTAVNQAVGKRFALVGSNGVVVEVLDLQDGQALVHIRGADGPLRDKVIAHRRSLEGQDLRYTTQWAGREWLTVLRSGTDAWVGTYWSLYQPGHEPISLAYSEARGEQIDADSLLATHERQKRAGELEQLQRFDQSSERGQEDATVSTSAGVANRECGSSLKAAIAWDTVSDQALREHSVSDYCISALRALQSACFASPELKAFVQQQVKDVTCRFDGQGEMRLDAGRLTWSMNLELGDLDTAASKALARIYVPES
jgi:hypothetical protein